MKIGIFGYDDTCVKAYDPSNQQVLGVYDTHKDAARFTGVGEKQVRTSCASKSRTFSRVHNKLITFRLSKKTTSYDNGKPTRATNLCK